MPPSIKNFVLGFLLKPRNTNILNRLLEIRYLIVGGNSFINQDVHHLKSSIIGRNNRIVIGKKALVKRGRLIVRGNNNELTIEKGCSIGPDCVFFLCGDNLKIVVGEKTTFTRQIEINAQEKDVSILIGADCMLSNNITIRTSDSHPIFDMENHQRLNPAKNIVIGTHVWIAPNTKIMKGANIGDGAVIGSDTTVSSYVPANTLCVGRPQKIVKEGIYWTRQTI